jgi:hypothetical protein
MNRAGVSILVGVLVGLAGVGTAAAQCYNCYSSSWQPNTTTMMNAAGTFVPRLGSPYFGPSAGTYGAGGSSLAPGRAVPTVAGSPISSWQYGEFLNTGSSNLRLGYGGYSWPAGSYPYGGVAVGAVPIGPSGTGAFYGDPGAAYVVADPSATTPGEWHPSSFYGPQTDLAPGRGAPAVDTTASWQSDPLAPARR